jgi:hypothetical protein
MKKQIIIFAAAIVPLAFFSCSKEKVETPQMDSSAPPNETAFKPALKPVINLDLGLVGRYEFDGNLKEYKGQLADAVPNFNGSDVYTVDRRGVPNNAIHFTGRYGLDISKVPLAPNMTVAAWVRYDMIQPLNYFVTAQWLSPDFVQDNNTYSGVVSAPATAGVQSGLIDNQWHHLVASYDGTTVTFYIDGTLIGTKLNPTQNKIGPKATVNYQVGYLTFAYSKVIKSTFFGSVDDLRFYTRILSPAEVTALYNL